MARVTRDLVVALRGLRRTPTFAIAVLAILGLGIGMAVATFTTLQTILVRRLPVQDQDRIAVLWTYQVPTIEYSVTANDLPDIRRASRTLREVAGVVHWGSAPEPFLDGDRTVVLRTGSVTTNYFDVLGARPVLGRFLRAEDAAAGAPEVMVLSYGAWQSQFGGSRSIIGSRLVNPWSRQAATVVGIAPPGLDYPVGIECWWPMEQGSNSQVLAVARLTPGVACGPRFMGIPVA